MPKTKKEETQPNIDLILTNKFKDLLNSLPNANYYNTALNHALEDLIDYSIAFEASIHKLNINNKKDILQVEESLTWIRSFYLKLAKIKLAGLMVDASALSVNKDQIISNLIDNLLPPVKNTPKLKSNGKSELDKLLSNMVKTKNTKI